MLKSCTKLKLFNKVKGINQMIENFVENNKSLIFLQFFLRMLRQYLKYYCLYQFFYYSRIYKIDLVLVVLLKFLENLQ